MAILGGVPMILILVVGVVIVSAVIGVTVALVMSGDKKTNDENSSKSDVKQDYFNQD